MDEGEFSVEIAAGKARVLAAVTENRRRRVELAAGIVIEKGAVPKLPPSEYAALAEELADRGRPELAEAVVSLAAALREARVAEAVEAVRAGKEIPAMPADEAVEVFERVTADQDEASRLKP